MIHEAIKISIYQAVHGSPRVPVAHLHALRVEQSGGDVAQRHRVVAHQPPDQPPEVGVGVWSRLASTCIDEKRRGKAGNQAENAEKGGMDSGRFGTGNHEKAEKRRNK